MPTVDPEAPSSSEVTAQTPLLAPDNENNEGGGIENESHVPKAHRHVSLVGRTRRWLRLFLNSKYGHYFVFLLVSLDIASIFAEFLVTLHICEHKRDKGFDLEKWETIEQTLGNVGLAFSSLFMAELLAAVFAFGLGYLKSYFHLFDAIVIVLAFIVDLLLKGPLQEAGSLVVILRLWRVFKIVEEFSTNANDQMEELHEQIIHLKRENDKVRSESDGVKGEIDELKRKLEDLTA